MDHRRRRLRDAAGRAELGLGRQRRYASVRRRQFVNAASSDQQERHDRRRGHRQHHHSAERCFRRRARRRPSSSPHRTSCSRTRASTAGRARPRSPRRATATSSGSARRPAPPSIIGSRADNLRVSLIDRPGRHTSRSRTASSPVNSIAMPSRQRRQHADHRQYVQCVALSGAVRSTWTVRRRPAARSPETSSIHGLGVTVLSGDATGQFQGDSSLATPSPVTKASLIHERGPDDQGQHVHFVNPEATNTATGDTPRPRRS